MKTNRILLVEDEANILASLNRHLRKLKLEVFTAANGQEGLVVLKEKGPFAVVVSDYRMPVMDGIEFLSRAGEMFPDTVRMILTGQTEIEVALNAVNRGKVFRFMLKPVSSDDFISSIQAGVEQYRLIKAEQELVDELTTMQQIDRELITSLDIGKAMRTTLDWAMRRSIAQAGFIATVLPEGLKIMASEGYDHEIQPYLSVFSADIFPTLNKALQTGQTQNVALDQRSPDRLLATARSQVVIPITREEQVIGVLLLENEGEQLLAEDTNNFLSHLSDHAAIAIANAQLYTAVQAANIAKSEFVSFVAHELKNPMTSIKGYTELLASGATGPINDSQSGFLSTIRNNVERMSTLVSDLADVSRIESGRLKMDLRSINVKEIIDETVRSQKRQIDEKKQGLTISLPDDLPPASADRMRLAQIVTNLLSNANKYTPPEGKIFLAAEACANQWDSKGTARVIHLWVQDNGIGINPEDQKKIFQKFFRADDSKTREAPGTGLGLNITRNLVEMQGGKIWFESEYRNGTTFHITIPVA